MTSLTHYYAQYDGSGLIIGLFNTKAHDKIPTPCIEITEKERDSIVCTPYSFSVVEGSLRYKGERKDEEKDSVSAKRKYEEKINAGFSYNGNIFAAFDKASANLVECLSIVMVDKSFKPELFIHTKDGLLGISVSKDTLLAVAKGVNKLRFHALLEYNQSIR